MGEITEVDVSQLRTVADRVMTAARQIAQMHCAGIDPGELAGAQVCGATAPTSVTDRLTAIVAAMRDWAQAACASADAFERTDRANGERLAR